MATVPVRFGGKMKEMVLEVIKNVRRQEYTPEKLCQLQKIIECKYFYWWCMDMKKEEYAEELFADDFAYSNGGRVITRSKEQQALNAKWSNKDMQTMHMGHQPMVWLIDDSHARGVFQYEDHMCYYSDGAVVENWMLCCDDFVKGEDGAWRISRLRMAVREMDGNYRDPLPPAGWHPEKWEKADY